MAFISINLGVFNLLPLPALDGGRLVFLLFEAVTRRKLRAKYEAIVHFAGIIMLFGLMIFATYSDITRLFA
jgi:regulator of sigma E protease